MRNKLEKQSERPKNLGGRPFKEIDMAQVKSLASLHCTDAEMCAVLGISTDTLARRKLDPEFMAVIENGRAMGKLSLRRAHFKLAQTNPAVHIFACKNWLGMSDKPEEDGPVPMDKARRIKEALDAIDGAIDGGRDEET